MWKKSDSNEPSLEPSPPSGASPAAPRAPQPPRAPSVDLGTIGPSITIRGEVTGNEDLIIRGRIEGTVTLPKNDVVLGEDGHVKANISAKKITVEGSVQGDLQGKELVTVKRTGSVHGNISAARVVLEDGCKFTGSIDMSASAAAQAPAGAGAAKPEAKKPEARPAGVADIKSVGDTKSAS